MVGWHTPHFSSTSFYIWPTIFPISSPKENVVSKRMNSPHHQPSLFSTTDHPNWPALLEELFPRNLTGLRHLKNLLFTLFVSWKTDLEFHDKETEKPDAGILSNRFFANRISSNIHDSYDHQDTINWFIWKYHNKSNWIRIPRHHFLSYRKQPKPLVVSTWDDFGFFLWVHLSVECFHRRFYYHGIKGLLQPIAGFLLRNSLVN